MNILTATGNLGRDCEVRFMADATPVGSFSFALSSGYGKNAKTTWIDCSLFGKRAETLAPMLLKGTQIGITGEISLRPYKAKDGTEKSSLECRVNDVTLLGGKSDKPAGAGSAPLNKGAGNSDPMDDVESDIPF